MAIAAQTTSKMDMQNVQNSHSCGNIVDDTLLLQCVLNPGLFCLYLLYSLKAEPLHVVAKRSIHCSPLRGDTDLLREWYHSE